MWAGLVTLSSIVSRRVWFQLGHIEILPHLYVVFVAPPGGRKSTAMDFSGRFLEEYGANLSVDCVTKESLVNTLAACEKSFNPPGGGVPFVYTPLTILATELSEFIGPSKDGMVSFLTTLFDKRGDYRSKTIKRGEEVIVKPCLTMLGCTTPAWITARLRDDVISGGFSRRANFVYEDEEPQRIAEPQVTPEHIAAWDEAMAYAKNNLSKVYGQFQWDEECRQTYVNWYNTREIPKDPMITGYHRSKHVQLFKLAMLISLSESTELVLRKRHWDFAFDLLGTMEQNLPRVFEGVGRNELAGAAATLHDFVRQAGGCMAEKQLYQLMFAHANESEIKQIIDHLVSIDKLVKGQITHKTTKVAITCLFTKDGLTKYQREIEYAQQRASATAEAGLLKFNPGANAGGTTNLVPRAAGG